MRGACVIVNIITKDSAEAQGAADDTESGNRDITKMKLDSAYEWYKADYKKAFGEDAPAVSVVRV